MPQRALAFGSWLEPDKAQAMERATDALRANGESFTMQLMTLAGHAVEAVNVRTDVTAIDLTGVAELVKTETDTIQVSAAPGADGIVRRMQQGWTYLRI